MNADHLAILEKMCENIDQLLEPNTPQYLYSAAVAQSWGLGTELEKNLYHTFIQRINKALISDLNSIMNIEERIHIDKWRMKANKYVANLHNKYAQAPNNLFIINAIKFLCTNLKYSENEVYQPLTT
jgi:hypothetical protein